MRKERRSMTLIGGLLGMALAAGAVAAEQGSGSAALPLDLAFSAGTIRLWDRPALSRDGRTLSYDVYSPPLRSPESQLAEGVRFLPSGTPGEMVGLRVFVVSTHGGDGHSVCPEGANCWRSSPSPDGRQVAFYCDAGGAPQLWVYEVAKGRSRRVSDAPIKVKHWPGDEAAWSADGRELFVPLRPAGQASPGAPLPPSAGGAPGGGPDKPAVTVYSTGVETAAPAGKPVTPEYLMAHFIRENNATLAAIDMATGKVRVVVPAETEPRPSCLRLSPDGRWVSYLSVFRTKGEAASGSFYDLAVAPASGGTPVVVASDVEVPEGSYFEGTYRWLPDSRRIVFLKDKKLWLTDATAPGAAPQRLGASLGNLEEAPVALTADGKAVLVGQEAEGEKAYYSVPPKALALVPLDGSQPSTFATVGTPVLADRDTLWSAALGRFAVVASDEATGDRSVVSVDARSGATTALWKGRGRIDVVGAADGGDLVARYESLDTPPDLYRFDRAFAGKQRLSHAEPRLNEVAVGPMEVFSSEVPGFDGRLLPVQTAVFLPKGKKAGDRLPGIVYFYSGSRMSTVAQQYGGGAPNSIPVQVFATRGYAVLLVDVPLGPEGKGGNPIQEMGDVILAQVYRAAERGYVDGARMAIMGQSYGGYSTAAMTTQTNLFRAAIALDGLYDLGSDFARMGPGGSSGGFMWSETGQGRMGTHPWGDLRRYIANSPYYQADKIHTPLLLIHGKKDETCAVEDAEKMFNALKRLGRTAELAVYDGEGHVPGTWSLVNAVDATQRMVEWLGTYMKPAVGGAAAKP